LKAGDILVVSAAGGGTGSIVGQIGKIHGLTVIGIAGTPEKVRWITEDLHFDHAINYKTENVEKRISELAPNGVNIYFDNVGGEILDSMLNNLALRGTIIACGAIHGYDSEMKGIKNYSQLIIKRAKIIGILVTDYAAEFGAAAQQMIQWVQEGKLKYREDIQEGFENIPKTFF